MNSEQSQQLPFESLAIGSRFRFPICLGHLLLHKGVYFKTGPGWYGTSKDQRLFPWLEEAPFVEVV